MYKFLAKHGQLVAFGLGALITLGFLGGVLGGIEGFSALADDERKTSDIFNFGLYAVIGLAILGVLAALVFGVIQTVSNPKGAIKGIAGLALIAVLFFVGQALAGADTAEILDKRQTFGVTDGQSSIINGAILGGMILAGLTAIAFVGGEILSFIKNSRS